MRVYLTGGTGLLGSHMAELLRRRGHEVVALCREGADVGFLETIGCELVTGDVRSSPAALAPGIGGCSHVVHGAALVYAGGSWSSVYEVNVEGSRNVAQAAAAADVGHFLHVSSVAVYGTVHVVTDEEHGGFAALPETDYYARSKREAEEVVRDVERSEGLPVTVMRPSAIYGERDRLMVPALARICRRRWVPLFGSGDNTLPVVYAGNVAQAMLLVLEASSGGPGSTYDVGLDHPLTQRELMSGLARGLGHDPRFLSVPARAVRAGVAILSRAGVGTPGARHLPLDRVARLALGENPYPSRRIRRELGWDPPFGHAEALERTGRWYTTI